MTIAELMSYLSRFDPDCPVEVLHIGTSWEWNEEEQESFPEKTTHWLPLQPDDINRLPDEHGTVRLGLDEGP